MKLTHFSATPVTQVRSVPQKSGIMKHKPQGFWVSDEDDYGWKEWCESEDFHVNGLVYAHKIELAPDANILYLRTPEQLDDFTAAYKAESELNRLASAGYVWDIDWDQVAHEYQGIIITPYQYTRRHTKHTIWYNGWDCASGCIWDAKAIKAITLTEGVKA